MKSIIVPEPMKKLEPSEEEMWINMGPQHPMTHGLWNLRVKVKGDTIIDSQPEIGYLHRGVEKIVELKEYFQILVYMDRLCYGSAVAQEAPYVGAVERLFNLEVPDRAQYIRTLMLELQRITSHLMWLAAYAADLGVLTIFLYAMRDRELFMDLFQLASGARLLPHYFRIGGVMNDINDDFIEETNNVLDYFEKRIDDYEGMLDESEIFIIRSKDVGTISAEKAANLGLTGPNVRGCGMEVDLRKDDPYFRYDKVSFEIPTEKSGDAYARYRVRMREMRESIKIARQVMKMLPGGEVLTEKIPKRPPKGYGYFHTEDPRGENAVYIVSDGNPKPYRFHFRSAAFVNISALPYLVKGCKIADVPAIVGSIDVCLGETDR